MRETLAKKRLLDSQQPHSTRTLRDARNFYNLNLEVKL